MEKGEIPNTKPALAALRLRDDRLESLKLLAGEIGHDFNNTLSPMLGYVSMIREEAAQGTNIQSYATALESVVRKVGKNLENLLLATRPQRRFHPELFDFHVALGNALEEWQSAAPPKTLVQVESLVEPCQLWGDRLQWRQVFLNLLSNAHSALIKGGQLSISLTKVLLSAEEIETLGLLTQDVMRLTINDTGKGMTEQVLAHAFDPFFSTRPKNQSQGLGLTLVHSVVHLHRGQVTVESCPDIGTTVKIWVPLGRPGELALS